MDISAFQDIVWQNYHTMDRRLPWRDPADDGTFDIYKILVSEVMLQQTQAGRVIPKYQLFIERFPDVHSLSRAKLADVIVAWSGLGYNRRAKYLHDAAKQLSVNPQPWTYDDLLSCKGIGSNTGAAICVYAYNEPLVFIETNIRTVFIHHFFPNEIVVDDKSILPLVEKTLPNVQEKLQYGPREWYWALMDYGVFIKSTVGNAARASGQYMKQTKFEGSNRQVRGQVLRLLAKDGCTFDELATEIDDERLLAVVSSLQDEGLVSLRSGRYVLG